LIGRWSFDSVEDLGKNAVTGAALVKSGNPVWSSNGKIGGAVEFNGSSLLSASTSTIENLPLGNTSYSVSLWFKARTLNYGGFIGWGVYGSQNKVNAFRLNGNASLHNYWWANDRPASLPSGSFTDGWHSVVGTWDGATRQIYIDGVSRDSISATGLNVGTNEFVVGKTINDANFTGWVDDLLIANRALTTAEIAALNATGIRDCALPTGTALRVAAGAALDLNGNGQTVAGLSGEGTVTGGVLTVTGRLSAGDAAGAIGTLAVNSGLTLASGVTNAVDCSTTEADAVNVKGTLTLLGSGMVEVSLSDPRHPPAQVTLFTFNALASGENLTSWSVTGVPGGFRAKLSTQANSIVMTISRVGTLISVK
jgi:hypothetical protein